MTFKYNKVLCLIREPVAVNAAFSKHRLGILSEKSEWFGQNTQDHRLLDLKCFGVATSYMRVRDSTLRLFDDK